MDSTFWSFSDDDSRSILGYRVEATDGHIGKVDETSVEVGASYIVVDTGPWIFGKKVLIPAGLISRVDHGDESVFIRRSKDEIKDSPELDENTFRDDLTYRDKLAGYYGPIA